MPLDIAVLVAFANDTNLQKRPSTVFPLEVAWTRAARDSAWAMVARGQWGTAETEQLRARLQKRLAADSLSIDSSKTRFMINALYEADETVLNGDQQRLLYWDMGNADWRYGPEVALVRGPEENIKKNLKKDEFRWLASLVNLSNERYPSLNIEAGASSCVFVGMDRQKEPSAYVFPVDDDDRCATIGNEDNDANRMTEAELEAMGGFRKLVVERMKATDIDFEESDIPSVARFEWPPGRKLQQIGVRCGGFWCQIKESRVDDLERTPGAKKDEPKKEAKVRRLKGWFDFQMLSERRQAQNGSYFLAPTAVFASVRPVKKEEMWNFRDVPSEYRAVATIVIETQLGDDDVYPEKYVNLGLTYGENILEFCQDSTSQACEVPAGSPPNRCAPLSPEPPRIWARIQPRGAASWKAFPVCQFQSDHGEFTARFRWNSRDDQVWARCPYGCCSVEF